MTINRVPSVPFAQIANSALRDDRLSFRARGILALVLSNSGEWSATRSWLEDQSPKEGRDAIQAALNELTTLGYRVVRKRQNALGKWESWVEWFHESADRQTGKPAVGFSGGIQNTIQNKEPVVSRALPRLRSSRRNHGV